MKKFEVIIDKSSHTYEIEADTKEEAEEKALEEFANNEDYTDYDYWVGECTELEKEVE